MFKKSVSAKPTSEGVKVSICGYTLRELESMLDADSVRRFEVSPRLDEVGGGWKLTLYEGKDEMGGGVFPPGDEAYSEAYQEGFDWQYEGL
jgi:hypothetical protein